MKKLSNLSLRGAERRGNLFPKITITLTLITLFILLTATLAHAKVIRDDATGGDCTTFGTWDAATKTCTMTTDLVKNNLYGDSLIQIANDGITLDGNYKIVNGDPTGIGILTGDLYGIGINLNMVKDVSVRNVNITGFWTAIYIRDYNYCTDGPASCIASNNKVFNSQIHKNIDGVYVLGSNNNLIENNRVFENGIPGAFFSIGSGIRLDHSNANLVKNNNVERNTAVDAIQIFASSEKNVISLNDISNNRLGLRINSKNNMIYNNNFISNIAQGGYQNVFNLDKPIGGNYWSNWTSPDNDVDGFVDNPYVFPGGQDNLPWTTPNGWLEPSDITPPQITVFAPEQRDYGLSEDITVAYDVTDDISGVNPASVSVTLDGAVVTNGQVIDLFDLPLGTHSFSITATDNAGNTASQDIVFNTVTSAEDLADVIEDLLEEGLITNPGVGNALLTQLDAGQLNAFINLVNAQSGNKIDPEAAAMLIAAAEAILTTLP